MSLVYVLTNSYYNQGPQGPVWAPQEYYPSIFRQVIGTCEPIDIAVTDFVSVIVCKDGTMMTEGNNAGRGLLGIDTNSGMTRKYYTPVKVVDGALFTSVICGAADCLARASNNFQIAYTVRIYTKF